MHFIDFILIFLIPFFPIIVGLKNSIAPLGGPLLLVGMQLLLGCTLKSIYLTHRPDLFLIYPWLQRSETSYRFAILFLLGFSLFTCLGYLIAGTLSKSGSRIFKQNLKFSEIFTLGKKKSLALIFITIISFTIITLLFVSKRGLTGSLTNIIISSNESKVDKLDYVSSFGVTNAFLTTFYVIPELCFYIFYSSILLVGKKTSYIKLGFFVSAFLVLFQALLMGKRNDLAGYFISILILTKFYKPNFTFKEIRFYSIFAVLSLLIFGTITFLRGGDNVSKFSIGSLISNILDPILSSTYFADINIVSSIIEKMNHKHDFFYGSTYLSLLTGLIPRDLWPDKPAISLGLYIKSEVLNMPGTLGGIPPTMPGEAFINFGWLGLLVACSYGFLLRRFEVFTLINNKSLNKIGIYVYSIFVVNFSWSLMQSSFSIVMVGSIVSLTLGIVFLYFIRRVKI